MKASVYGIGGERTRTRGCQRRGMANQPTEWWRARRSSMLVRSLAPRNGWRHESVARLTGCGTVRHVGRPRARSERKREEASWKASENEMTLCVICYRPDTERK